MKSRQSMKTILLSFVVLCGGCSDTLDRNDALELLEEHETDFLSTYDFTYDVELSGPSPERFKTQQAQEQASAHYKLLKALESEGVLKQVQFEPPRYGPDYKFTVADPSRARAGRVGMLVSDGAKARLIVGTAFFKDVTGIAFAGDDRDEATVEVLVACKPSPLLRDLNQILEEILSSLRHQDKGLVKLKYQPISVDMDETRKFSFHFKKWDDGWRVDGRR